MTPSPDVPDLYCPDCGRRYPAGPDEPWRCPHDAGPLELLARSASSGDGEAVPDGDPATAPATYPCLRGDTTPTADTRVDARDGLWAFDSFLPGGSDRGSRVTLGEGFTPLVDAPAWDAAFKLDYVFPTGSFKDRGATTTLSRAKALGVDRVVEDSSGNAGAAIATYAARAGIDAEVYVPADAKASKLRAIERAGATPVRIEGSRAAVTDACVAAVEGDGDAWYASHAWNPAFYAGTATLAFEIAAQREWSVPDAVVLPLGHGTMLLGAYRGFRALAEAGWTDRVPRLLAAQAAGHAPVVDRLRGPAAAAGDNDRADGIQIDAPAREHQVLAAIKATDGDAVAIDGAAVDAALDRLHCAGFYTEPTCAVAPAALERFRDEGVLEGDGSDRDGEGEDVVVALSGSGLKT